MSYCSQLTDPLLDAPSSASSSPSSYSYSIDEQHSFTNKETIEIQHNEADSPTRLLLLNQCYEAMPASSKLVVFDQDLLLRKAFNGLIYQCTRHVLLSDGTQKGIITGILSLTDFVRVILRLHKERVFLETQVTPDLTNEREDIGRLTIKTYRELMKKEGKLTPLMSINADRSLLEAARMLATYRIHRLPVMDPESGSPLFILTHKRLFKFLWCFGQQFSNPEYHTKTAKELGVGTWAGIRVVFPDTPLVDFLDILVNTGVSSLPVVERESFKVVDIYSQFDVVETTHEDREHNLDCTVAESLTFKNCLKTEDRVVSVRETDTLWEVMTVFAKKNVHRLCVVNERGAIKGIISLSDVINNMVIQPGADLELKPPRKKHYSHHMGGDLSDQYLRNRLSESAQFLEEEAQLYKNDEN